jgi:hypothetical protein
VIDVRVHAKEDGYGDHAMPDDLLIIDSQPIRGQQEDN